MVKVTGVRFKSAGKVVRLESHYLRHILQCR